jgi:hypothetical protein
MLAQIAQVDVSELRDLDSVELIVATDVTNPLLGSVGAAAVFGPQKGVAPLQVAHLEARLAHLARLLRTHAGRAQGSDIGLAEEPGAGAGGLSASCRGGVLPRPPRVDTAISNAPPSSPARVVSTGSHSPAHCPPSSRDDWRRASTPSSASPC